MQPDCDDFCTTGRTAHPLGRLIERFNQWAATSVAPGAEVDGGTVVAIVGIVDEATAVVGLATVVVEFAAPVVESAAVGLADPIQPDNANITSPQAITEAEPVTRRRAIRKRIR